MRTKKEIKRKISGLKSKLKKKKITENFGQKEVINLDEFVGGIFEYPYNDRLEIQKMVDAFFKWCLNYIG